MSSRRIGGESWKEKLSLLWDWVKSRSRRDLVLFVVGMALVLGVGVALVLLTKFGVVGQFVDVLRSLGRVKAGAVLFLLFVVCTTPFTSFAGVMSVICGFLLGNVAIAFGITLAGLCVGSLLTILLCRKLFKDRASAFVSSTRVLDALRKKADWRLAILIRVGGIPIGVVNALLAGGCFFSKIVFILVDFVSRLQCRTFLCSPVFGLALSES
jgi:uncharacterized membrane protein YdjX (TVP38/TMEM64 family)